jgi:hypothetical protein
MARCILISHPCVLIIPCLDGLQAGRSASPPYTHSQPTIQDNNPTLPQLNPDLSIPNIPPLQTLPTLPSPETSTRPSVPDDIWLSAPLPPEGDDARQIWGDMITGSGGGGGGVGNNGSRMDGDGGGSYRKSKSSQSYFCDWCDILRCEAVWRGVCNTLHLHTWSAMTRV